MKKTVITKCNSSLRRELEKNGILFCEEDMESEFFAIEGNLLIMKVSFATIAPVFRIYDLRTLQRVGGQNVRPDDEWFAIDVWESWGEYDFTMEEEM